MKFITFHHDDQKTVGLLDEKGTRLWPVPDLVPNFTGDMLALIREFADARTHLAPGATSGSIALDSVTVCAPIPKPDRNILCVGKNYREHAKEFTQSGFDATSKAGDHVPDDPIIFTKASNTVIGPGETVPNHAELTKQLDYEAELAVVIGKGGSRISRAKAYDHVFGCMIANDITARDLQLKHRQWFIGKSLDRACPMGPWIATRDELDIENLSVRCWVNDELRQDANTGELIFDIPTLIETLSAGMTLEPGDIISTGTPAGVGIGFDPPRFLKQGDTVRIEIDGLGQLVNSIE